LRFSIPFKLYLDKKNLLIAFDKQKIVNIIDGLISLLTYIAEILILFFISKNIFFVLASGILLHFIAFIIYKFLYLYFFKSFNLDIKPTYISISISRDITLHQVSSLLNNNTDIVLLSFLEITLVTIYSAYNSLINLPVSIFNQIFNTFKSDIGLKMVNSNNIEYLEKKYFKLLIISLYIGSIISLVFFFRVNSFITLWIGGDFTISIFTVSLFSILLFRKFYSIIIIIYRDSKGLFSESKFYTIISAVINIILSLILFYIIGLNGVLVATAITSVLIMDFGNINLIDKKLFRLKGKSVIFLFKTLFIILLTSFLIPFIINFSILTFNPLVTFFLNSILNFIAVITIISIMYKILFYYDLKKLFNF
jgi:O-antigen/teichoic acid export membrane protein